MTFNWLKKDTLQSPYYYNGTNILINKADIRNQVQLDRFERRSVRQRLDEGLPKINLTEKGYKSIHHHLFQDVYDWAGEYRITNIGKNKIKFIDKEYISDEMNRIFINLENESFLNNLTKPLFSNRTSEYIRELNNTHAFREGNGRVMRCFLSQLCEQSGYQIDLTKITRASWMKASIEASENTNTNPMTKLIYESIEEKSIWEDIDQIKLSPDKLKDKDYER